MASGLPDIVECAPLAEQAMVLDRVYLLSELPRLKEILVQPHGELGVRFAFYKLGPGRSGATVTISATAELECQRCLQGFRVDLKGDSEIEFANDDTLESSDSDREFFRSNSGLVSLREMAEEEVLLALPVAPACRTPLTCGKFLGYTDDDAHEKVNEARRPFSGLQELMKKT